MPIELVWTTGLEEPFDPRHFASNLLEDAKENLSRDGYLQAAIFVVTTTELHCFSVQFEGYEGKEAAYCEAIRQAQELGARAIITLNDAFVGDKYEPDKYQWGDAAADPKGECIFVTVSGRGIENWTKEVKYHRDENGLKFDKATEENKSFIGFLGDWARSGQRVN